MSARGTPSSYAQPVKAPANVVAELVMAMPIVLLVNALYEAFIEPALAARSLRPSQQG